VFLLTRSEALYILEKLVSERKCPPPTFANSTPGCGRSELFGEAPF
jgi:hypothetical protein